MPTTLTFEQHLNGLHEAMLAFARHATTAGLDVDVPTCPDWTVRRLIGHQGAVHRWASGALRGESLDKEPVARAGRRSDDPVAWLRDGAIDLVSSLVAAPADVAASVFLPDAPPPRHFWARRQCHETTIHAVDALAAELGRLPRAAETWIGRDLALDGIDELVLGLVPQSRLRSATPLTIAVRPNDADFSLTVRVSPDPPVAVRRAGVATGDLVVDGAAAQLYLALWHRSDELESEVWPLWRDCAV